MVILGFQAGLRLQTCREYCLEQNPSIFVIFGAHLVIFRKLRLVWFLLLCIFYAFFWVWIEGLMFEDGNLCIFVEKCARFWEEIFFFFSRTKLCSARGKDEQGHADVIKKTIFVFCLPWYSWIDYAYIRIIMHLLKLTLLGQLL